MMSKDGTDPRAPFVGIDFTVEIRTPGVFDHEQLRTTVEGVIFDFYQRRHISARPCFPGGLGGAVGGSLIELVNWVRENWEFLTTLVTALSAGIYKIQRLAARERTRLTNGVIDPYRPGIVVTISPRTGSLDDDASDEDKAAFAIVLSMLPELHTVLVEAVSTHDFSMRAIRCGRAGAVNAFFKLKATTARDVAMMVKKIETLDAQGANAPTILLYRQFGLFRRFDVSKNPGDLYRLIAR